MAQFNSKNQSSTVAKRWFTDIDINMSLHPESEDLALKYDINAVKRSIRNILLTNNYERPFKPSFGSNMRGMLFELATSETKIIKRNITEAIRTFEPRVTIDNIHAKLIDNSMKITILFGIRNVPGSQELDVIVERVR